MIFYSKVDHSFTILKGTALCQIIPYKREDGLQHINCIVKNKVSIIKVDILHIKILEQ